MECGVTEGALHEAKEELDGTNGVLPRVVAVPGPDEDRPVLRIAVGPPADVVACPRQRPWQQSAGIRPDRPWWVELRELALESTKLATFQPCGCDERERRMERLDEPQPVAEATGTVPANERPIVGGRQKGVLAGELIPVAVGSNRRCRRRYLVDQALEALEPIRRRHDSRVADGCVGVHSPSRVSTSICRTGMVTQPAVWAGFATRSGRG